MQDLAVVLSGNQGDKDVEVIFDIDPELPSAVVGDRLRLQQILINLAGNALKFTARGHVLVSLRRLAHDAHLVRLRVLVADTGIGISAEQQQRIFEEFHPGRGVHLATLRRHRPRPVHLQTPGRPDGR